MSKLQKMHQNVAGIDVGATKFLQGKARTICSSKSYGPETWLLDI